MLEDKENQKFLEILEADIIKPVEMGKKRVPRK